MVESRNIFEFRFFRVKLNSHHRQTFAFNCRNEFDIFDACCENREIFAEAFANFLVVDHAKFVIVVKRRDFVVKSEIFFVVKFKKLFASVFDLQRVELQIFVDRVSKFGALRQQNSFEAQASRPQRHSAFFPVYS